MPLGGSGGMPPQEIFDFSCPEIASGAISLVETLSKRVCHLDTKKWCRWCAKTTPLFCAIIALFSVTIAHLKCQD